jgi:hypothetical protein
VSSEPGSADGGQVLKLAILGTEFLALAWVMMPEHARRLILMRAAHRARIMLGLAARRAGHAAMGSELATGQREYTAPLILSAARDMMTRAYDRLRYAR